MKKWLYTFCLSLLSFCLAKGQSSNGVDFSVKTDLVSPLAYGEFMLFSEGKWSDHWAVELGLGATVQRGFYSDRIVGLPASSFSISPSFSAQLMVKYYASSWDVWGGSPFIGLQSKNRQYRLTFDPPLDDGSSEGYLLQWTQYGVLGWSYSIEEVLVIEILGQVGYQNTFRNYTPSTSDSPWVIDGGIRIGYSF